MKRILLDPGSFRDPDWGVVHSNGRVFRYFTTSGARNFEAFANSGLLESLVSSGRTVGVKDVGPDVIRELRVAVPEAALIVEHPRVPFISYCYEWSFEMLKSAALLQLDLLRSRPVKWCKSASSC